MNRQSSTPSSLKKADSTTSSSFITRVSHCLSIKDYQKDWHILSLQDPNVHSALLQFLARIMWKPGTAKPNGSTPSSSTKRNKKKQGSRSKLDPLSINDGDGVMTTQTLSKTPSSGSKTPLKRLSGGTMNMRFMKRRKDEISSNKSNNEEENMQSHSKKSSPHSRIQTNDAMDTGDGHDDSSTEMDDVDGSNYAQANSVDMYGIEASLIGRRSFRGFNEPIERIWKDSKACIENGEVSSRKGKVSDEELLLRYHDISSQRRNSSGERGIGSLDKKSKNKKRR
mmetsp:Transcript_20642/g.44943  ORF Transcript_20642/g.44943 Transcript_20642/m.44943 type:complete len:282 (+) Transcript_20642:59-904(+)